MSERGGYFCCAGGVGLTQQWFWFSTVTVYVGALLVLGDLFYEHLPIGLKAVAATMIVAGLFVFSVVVVRRKAPLWSDYYSTGGTVTFVLRNDFSEDDYHNVDITIWPDGDRGSTIVTSAQVTNGYPAQIINTATDHINGKRTDCPPESVFVYSTGKSYVALPNTIRIRSEVLPRGANIELTTTLSNDRYSVARSFPGTPLTDLSHGLIDGKLDGRFKEFRIHQSVQKR